MKHFTTLLLALMTIALMLFLNGNLPVKGIPLPPLAKLLHPINGIWCNGETSTYQDQKFSFSKMKGKGEIIYDERRIPHIFADDMEGALFLQGYVEAANRLFQMDFMTRAASGRISEIMGPSTLNFDKERNRSQIELAADNAVKGWEKHGKELILLQSYVDGVNAYISSLEPKDYPYEYKLLNFAPELWSLKKTALVYKSMADVLAGASEDMEYSNALALLGRAMFDKIYPEYDDGGYPVIPYEKKYDFRNPMADEKPDSIISKKYYKYFYKNRQKGAGSNNWAVGPKKTKAGKSILCNDPHLGLSLPSIWIEEHICTPAFNTYGVSFPGFPGIMIGFNEHIAWGETNVGQDIEDLFEVKWANKEKSKYWLDGKQVDTKFVVKKIKVRNNEDVLDTLKYIDKGVVKLESADGNSDIAVRWLAADEPEQAEFMVFLDIMKSKNQDEFKSAISRFNTPAQNFLYADKDGNIGLTVNGKFPIRQREDGRFVESASMESTDWSGFMTRDHIPQIFNPAQGYLSSSNQRSAGNNYPYYYTGKFEHARNRVINDTLQKYSNFDIASLQKLQGNNFNVFAYDCKAAILSALETKFVNHPIFNRLKNWDCKFESSSVAATNFEILFSNIYNNTFDEILQHNDSIDVPDPEDWVLVKLLSKEASSEIFDMVATSNTKETMKEIVIKSFEDLLSDKYKSDIDKSWGSFRKVNINHYTRLPALSVTGLQLDGTPDAINALNTGFGPSWRMVVEPGNANNAFGVFPGGQSGNPLSPFYKNNIDTWAQHKYFKLNSSNNKSEIKITQKLIIN